MQESEMDLFPVIPQQLGLILKKTWNSCVPNSTIEKAVVVKRMN